MLSVVESRIFFLPPARDPQTRESFLRTPSISVGCSHIETHHPVINIKSASSLDKSCLKFYCNQFYLETMLREIYFSISH